MQDDSEKEEALNDESKKVNSAHYAPETFKMWSLGFTLLKSFYRHSDFMWNQILENSNGLKMSFLAILDTLNFETW